MFRGIQRVRRGGVGKNYDEFFTAVTRAAIGFAGRVAHDLRDRLQHLVARGVAECVVVLLEVIDISDQNREAALVLSEAGHFVVEPLHQGAMVGQARQAVRGREQLQLFVFLDQRFVDAIELGTSIAQAIDHVIEHVGQVPYLAAAGRCGQIDGEITSCDFTRRLRQAVQWPRDQSPESISRRRHCHQQERDHQQRDISEATHLHVCRLRRNLGDDGPAHLRHVLESADHVATGVAVVLERSARSLAQLLHSRGGQRTLDQLFRDPIGAGDGAASGVDEMDCARAVRRKGAE